MSLPARARLVRWSASLGAACCMACAPQAHAVLGERVETVHADQMRLQGARRLSTALRYQVHDIRMADGSSVRQFASPGGQVFALVHDAAGCLRAGGHLLIEDVPGVGKQYFSGYSEARLASVKGHGFARQSVLTQGALVVHESAHMGMFAGLAYVRHLVPEGVDPNALR